MTNSTSIWMTTKKLSWWLDITNTIVIEIKAFLIINEIKGICPLSALNIFFAQQDSTQIT